MKEFRIVPYSYGRNIVERRYKLFFGLIKTWRMAFPDRIFFTSIRDAVNEIVRRYPQGALSIYKGRKEVLHFKRDK